MTNNNTILDILNYDNNNTIAILQVLDKYGITKAVLGIPELFKFLKEIIDKEANSRNTNPFIQIKPDGTHRQATDLILRLHMMLSAEQQFTLAATDLLRGHTPEAHSKIRRAVEGVGIAYLSVSEPDLGELYLTNNRKEYRTRTSTRKLFPTTDPIPASLKETIDISSQMIHNNIVSFAGKLKHNFGSDGKTWYANIHISYHDNDPNTNINYFLNFVLWMSRAAERAARLLAKSFQVTTPQWNEYLEKYKTTLDQYYIKYDAILRSTFTSTSATANAL